MAVTWWSSPAKLNLFLHITDRLANGYHELQTVFQMLDVGDRLSFELSDTISMTNHIDGVAEVDNLIVKAAKLLAIQTTKSVGCKITLDKVLPMGGGVGGGSSNAATTLLVLNQLWDLNLATSDLLLLGKQLGADVPVFIHGHTTFAEGIGEHFTDIAIPSKYYLVCHPNVNVSTQAIFTHPELLRNTPKILSADYDFHKTHNDCQEIVCKQHPEVANLLHWLLQFAPSRMTGTGACVFAVFETRKEAEQIHHKLPKHWSGFVAKGTQTSPLIDQLSNRKSDN